MWYIAALAAGFLITSLIAGLVRNRRIKRLLAESKTDLRELRRETTAVLQQLQKAPQQHSETTTAKTLALEETGDFNYQEPPSPSDSPEYKPFIELSLYVGPEYKLTGGRKTRAHGKEEIFPIKAYADWSAAWAEIDKIVRKSRLRSTYPHQASVS